MHKVITFIARISFISGAAILLVMLGAAFAPVLNLQTAKAPVAPSIGQAQTIVKGHTDQELKDAFDRGMGAGVEYQTWFCTHTVTPQPAP
jgi:predicted esterase